jgi:glucose-6-phosphate isomerase
VSAADPFPTAVVARLWARDTSLFAAQESRRAAVANRLGWLDAPGFTLAGLAGMEDFAREVRRDGLTTAVLLGMGGSSLCPLVLSETFPPVPGALALRVVDTTSPGTVRGILEELDPAASLVIVASKSGGTIEPNALYRVFREWVDRAVPDPGRHFAAITDPGTSLASLAAGAGFRRVFTAPPDVGGRFSALTVFGMLPAALLGLDCREMLAHAQAMADRCRLLSEEGNPGLELGRWLAHRAGEGRDKLTLLVSPGLRSLALWLEQLVAESTGKEGLGLLPVAGEPELEAADYTPDRAFVLLSLAEETPVGPSPSLLRGAGHPVLELFLPSPLHLGAEFFRWEAATAVAGALLGINPFDEPNVTESKVNTQAILGGFPRGVVPQVPGGATRGRVTVYPQEGAEHLGGDAALLLEDLLARAGGGSYLAILAYLPYSPGVEEALLPLRRHAARRGLASTFGYGPRYLHSTGQIHKGGPPRGLFLILTSAPDPDLPVPGEDYSLGGLHLAQALGDQQALRQRGFPTLRLHLGGGPGDLPSLVGDLLP